MGWQRRCGWLRPLAAAVIGASAVLWQPLVPAAPEPQPAATGPRTRSALTLAATRAGSRLVVAGERGIILTSDDEGESWRQASVPVDATLTGIRFVDSRHGWAIGHDSVILESLDGAENWHLQHRDISEGAPLLDLLFVDPQRGFIVGARGNLFTTDDGGKTWSQRQLLGLDQFESELDAHLFGITQTTSGRLLIGAEQGILFKSDDLGVTWQQIPIDYDGSLFAVRALADNRVLATGMLGKAFISEDSGNHWRRVETGLDKSIMSIRLGAGNRVLLAGLAGRLAVSDDGASSFRVVNLHDRRDLADVLPIGSDQWLLAGVGGVRRVPSPDNAASP